MVIAWLSGLFAPWGIGVVQGESVPAPRTTVAVTVLGERADSWRMERAVESLLGLEGITVEWRRSQVAPSPGESRDDRVPGIPARRVLVDLHDSSVVILRWLTAGDAAPAARMVAAGTLDEANCESIAQILRSVLLAPQESAHPAVPISAATASAMVLPTPTPAPAPSSPSPFAARSPIIDLRFGYVATGQGSDSLFLAGPTLAGSWAVRGKKQGGSPTVGLSVTRTSAVFADAAAPADASVVLWSVLAGVGWEYAWADAWWLAVEANIGPDRIGVTPRANGGTAGLQLAAPQTAVRVAVVPAIRGEVRLAGPVVLFLQAQANLTPGARVDFTATDTSRSRVIEGRMILGGAIGAALRW